MSAILSKKGYFPDPASKGIFSEERSGIGPTLISGCLLQTQIIVQQCDNYNRNGKYGILINRLDYFPFVYEPK